MKDLLDYLVRELVDEPDAVQIEEAEDDRGVVYTLRVGPDDMGKVIGRGGRRRRLGAGAAAGRLARSAR